MRYLYLLSLILLASVTYSNSKENSPLPNDSKDKVDLLNDRADKFLANPTEASCNTAKSIALDAAAMAERLDYRMGMQRSYKQLVVIYNTLDIKVQAIKYKTKATMVDISKEVKEKSDQIEKQNREIEKQEAEMRRKNEEILKQKANEEKIKQEVQVLENDKSANKELIAQKQKELSKTSGQLIVMTEAAVKLATENKLLEQAKLIKELEVEQRKLENINLKNQQYYLLLFVAVLFALASVLFNLYKTKQRTAKELAKKTEIIIAEKKRSDELLLNILPLQTANELKANGKAIARDYEMVTVLFTDFKDFTLVSEKLSPKDLVDVIDMCYIEFDNITEKFGIEKIKTIGDAYLCAQGLANDDLPSQKQHDPSRVINAALEIIDYMSKMYDQRIAEGKPFFRIRIGVHSGPLVAGVVGRKKFAYDIWGDTVNTAARMEQNSEPGKVNVSANTYNMVKDQYNFIHRGKIEAKNKGQIDMYFVEKKS